jgi:AMP nucleosidase
MHMDAFEALYPGCVKPDRATVQMPAYHHEREGNCGFTIVNIGVGPSNAKNCTDHLAVLRPDAMVMVGHCGGIRNHQEIGDFVLASGYMRGDRVLDDALPIGVPVVPSDLLNRYLAAALEAAALPYRLGTVYTTADRNWELALSGTLNALRLSRSLAIDMESATVAANGFRYRIPHATLLCVSDKPLHGQPKLPAEAKRFYRDTQKKHIAIAVRALELARTDWPDGLPTSSIRGLDEPLMGGPEDA